MASHSIKSFKCVVTHEINNFYTIFTTYTGKPFGVDRTWQRDLVLVVDKS